MVELHIMMSFFGQADGIEFPVLRDPRSQPIWIKVSNVSLVETLGVTSSSVCFLLKHTLASLMLFLPWKHYMPEAATWRSTCEGLAIIFGPSLNFILNWLMLPPVCGTVSSPNFIYSEMLALIIFISNFKWTVVVSTINLTLGRCLDSSRVENDQCRDMPRPVCS